MINGIFHFSEEKYLKAIEAYNLLLNEPEGTIPLRVSALLTLGQLYLSQEDYNKGIKYILQWMDEVETVTAQAWPNSGAAWDGNADFKKLVFFVDGGSSTPGVYHFDDIKKN